MRSLHLFRSTRLHDAGSEPAVGMRLKRRPDLIARSQPLWLAASIISGSQGQRDSHYQLQSFVVDITHRFQNLDCHVDRWT